MKLHLALAGALLGAAISAPAADPAVVPVEGASYRTTTSMSDNLEHLRGKRVTLTLDSGATVSGQVASVGPRLVHISHLSGKEYFDALVEIESISALETRFRESRR